MLLLTSEQGIRLFLGDDNPSLFLSNLPSTLILFAAEISLDLDHNEDKINACVLPNLFQVLASFFDCFHSYS